MRTYTVAVIPGDGIGPEVITEGVRILEEAARLDGRFSFQFEYYPWGCEYYLKYGRMMAEDGIRQLSHFDAIFLGAVGYPGVPDHISLRDLLLNIRKSFDQYVNLRPVKLLRGAPCPLKGVEAGDIPIWWMLPVCLWSEIRSGSRLLSPPTCLGTSLPISERPFPAGWGWRRGQT